MEALGLRLRGGDGISTRADSLNSDCAQQCRLFRGYLTRPTLFLHRQPLPAKPPVQLATNKKPVVKTGLLQQRAVGRSKPLDHRRGGHALGNAHRLQAVACATTLHFRQQLAHEDGARRAERMAMRNRTAIHIHLL